MQLPDGPDMLSDFSPSCFSKSAVPHLRTGSRTASWEGWMKVWMSFSLRKSPRWIPSKDFGGFLPFFYYTDFFCLNVHLACLIFCSSVATSPLPPPHRRSLKASESQDGEKKKSKGGFLNLIKRSSKSDKSDKSEKNQTTTTASVASMPASTIIEEPSSPKLSVKSPAPETKSR